MRDHLDFNGFREKRIAGSCFNLDALVPARARGAVLALREAAPAGWAMRAVSASGVEPETARV